MKQRKQLHSNARWNCPKHRLDPDCLYNYKDRYWEPMTASVTLPWNIKDALKSYCLKYELKMGYRIPQGEIVAEAVRRYMAGTMHQKHRLP
jgi:hypothetical protein